MKLTAQTVLKGVFYFEHRDSNGNLKERFQVDNTVTTAGKGGVTAQLYGGATARFKYLALDASSTAAAAANTTLASEITSPSLKRASSTSTQATTTVSNDTLQNVHTFGSTATQTVYGVGLFNTSTSGGTLMSRTTFAAKNLASGDTLQVTHKLIVA